MRLNDLMNQLADAIRVHHASGHFDHDTAHARLVAQTSCTPEKADEILAAPIPARMFDEHRTHPRADRTGACDTCGRTGFVAAEAAA